MHQERRPSIPERIKQAFRDRRRQRQEEARGSQPDARWVDDVADPDERDEREPQADRAEDETSDRRDLGEFLLRNATRREVLIGGGALIAGVVLTKCLGGGGGTTDTKSSGDKTKELEKTPAPEKTSREPKATTTPKSTRKSPSPSPEPTLNTCESPFGVGETCEKGNLAVTLSSQQFDQLSSGDELFLEWRIKNTSLNPLNISLRENNWRVTDNLNREYDIYKSLTHRFSNCPFVGDSENPSLIFSLAPEESQTFCMNIRPNQGSFNPGNLSKINLTFNKGEGEDATWEIPFE